MTKNSYRVVLTLIFLSFLLSKAYSAPWDIDSLVGTFAPEFTLKDVKGRDVSLSDFRGKVVFLNFWATWCPPCKEEIPSLKKLQVTYRKKGLVVIGIASDRSLKQIKNFLKKHALNYTVLIDSDIKITHKYKVFALPTSFLIDRRGRIVKKFIGAFQFNDKEIKEIIDSL